MNQYKSCVATLTKNHRFYSVLSKSLIHPYCKTSKSLTQTIFIFEVDIFPLTMNRTSGRVLCLDVTQKFFVFKSFSMTSILPSRHVPSVGNYPPGAHVLAHIRWLSGTSHLVPMLRNRSSRIQAFRVPSVL